MPPKQPDPQKELNILLQRARRNSRNPLLVKVLDWTGNTVQSILLCDGDTWVRNRLRYLMGALREYYHVPLVTILESLDDKSIGPMTRVLLQNAHHIVMTQSNDPKPICTNITVWKDETQT